MASLSPFEGVFFGKVILQRSGTKVCAITRARVARSVDAFSIRFTRGVPKEREGGREREGGKEREKENKGVLHMNAISILANFQVETITKLSS